MSISPTSSYRSVDGSTSSVSVVVHGKTVMIKTTAELLDRHIDRYVQMHLDSIGRRR